MSSGWATYVLYVQLQRPKLSAASDWSSGTHVRESVQPITGCSQLRSLQQCVHCSDTNHCDAGKIVNEQMKKWIKIYKILQPIVPLLLLPLADGVTLVARIMAILCAVWAEQRGPVRLEIPSVSLGHTCWRSHQYPWVTLVARIVAMLCADWAEQRGRVRLGTCPHHYSLQTAPSQPTPAPTIRIIIKHHFTTYIITIS